MKPSEALQELNKMKSSMETYLHTIGGAYMDEVAFVSDDPNESLIRNQLHYMTDKIDDIVRELKYLSLNVIEEGPLYLNDLERFELPSGHEYTSGSTIEILYYDKFYEQYKWVLTSIEHTDGHYYATALGKDVNIEGLTARRRQVKY